MTSANLRPRWSNLKILFALLYPVQSWALPTSSLPQSQSGLLKSSTGGNLEHRASNMTEIPILALVPAWTATSPTSTSHTSPHTLSAPSNRKEKRQDDCPPLPTTEPSDHATLAQDVFAVQNIARTAPETFARCAPGLLQDSLEFLNGRAPIPALTWSVGLEASARDLVLDQGNTGEIGHSDSQGNSPFDRMARHGDWVAKAAENIMYGSHSGTAVIVDLINDVGVPDKGHRTNIFDSGLLVVGVSCGDHPVYRVMCNLDYAQDFVEYTAQLPSPSTIVIATTAVIPTTSQAFTTETTTTTAAIPTTTTTTTTTISTITTTTFTMKTTTATKTRSNDRKKTTSTVDFPTETASWQTQESEPTPTPRNKKNRSRAAEKAETTTSPSSSDDSVPNDVRRINSESDDDHSEAKETHLEDLKQKLNFLQQLNPEQLVSWLLNHFNEKWRK
ncbi:hypothetical protein HK102_000926 [Quaeritorhiza haematococci]|nr:hypothetical protein HK102_000926 [Quaeritorhiza haematococci]